MTQQPWDHTILPCQQKSLRLGEKGCIYPNTSNSHRTLKAFQIAFYPRVMKQLNPPMKPLLFIHSDSCSIPSQYQIVHSKSWDREVWPLVRTLKRYCTSLENKTEKKSHSFLPYSPRCQEKGCTENDITHLFSISRSRLMFFQIYFCQVNASKILMITVF